MLPFPVNRKFGSYETCLTRLLGGAVPVSHRKKLNMDSRESKDEDRLLSLPEAAEIYGFHPEYLGNLARRGRLKAQKVGGRWITTPRNMANFIRSRAKMGVYRKDIKLD